MLVDRVTWLAAASPNAQVRAIASLKLERLAARLRAANGGAAAQGSQAESERAHRTLMAADIKRFLERPMNDALSARIVPPSPAPPGAPIGGDVGQHWLARPPMCEWDNITPEMWLHYVPQQ